MGGRQSFGPDFRVLGVEFDPKLLMASAVHQCVTEATWKVKSILRTKRFYTDAEVIRLYKSHVLSFLEYRTPAIGHASDSILEGIERIQRRVLRELGLEELDALLYYNLAPLQARRDIAMLGVLHRAALGKGPPQFQKFFFQESVTQRVTRVTRTHCRNLADPYSAVHRDYIRHCAFGYVWVYKCLPPYVAAAHDTKSLQSLLQVLMKHCAAHHDIDWMRLFSPRVSYLSYPLLHVS